MTLSHPSFCLSFWFLPLPSATFPLPWAVPTSAPQVQPVSSRILCLPLPVGFAWFCCIGLGHHQLRSSREKSGSDPHFPPTHPSLPTTQGDLGVSKLGQQVAIPTLLPSRHPLQTQPGNRCLSKHLLNNQTSEQIETK